MLHTASTSNYSHADIVAMLSAMPKEEQRWTWNYLNSIFVVPAVQRKRRINLSPELEAFMGMGKSTDRRGWKQQKEDYLDERFEQ